MCRTSGCWRNCYCTLQLEPGCLDKFTQSIQRDFRLDIHSWLWIWILYHEEEQGSQGEYSLFFYKTWLDPHHLIQHQIGSRDDLGGLPIFEVRYDILDNGVWKIYRAAKFETPFFDNDDDEGVDRLFSHDMINYEMWQMSDSNKIACNGNIYCPDPEEDVGIKAPNHDPSDSYRKQPSKRASSPTAETGESIRVFGLFQMLDYRNFMTQAMSKPEIL